MSFFSDELPTPQGLFGFALPVTSQLGKRPCTMLAPDKYLLSD